MAVSKLGKRLLPVGQAIFRCIQLSRIDLDNIKFRAGVKGEHQENGDGQQSSFLQHFILLLVKIRHPDDSAATPSSLVKTSKIGSTVSV